LREQTLDAFAIGKLIPLLVLIAVGVTSPN